MTPREVSKELRFVQEKYKDAFTPTFQIRISDMAKEAADAIDTLLNIDHIVHNEFNVPPALQEELKNEKYDKSYESFIEKISVPPVRISDIQTAMSVLRAAFVDKHPGSYYHGWQSNLACCIMDKYSHVDGTHAKANGAAKAFLDLLCKE